jgi:hypothetical protein
MSPFLPRLECPLFWFCFSCCPLSLPEAKPCGARREERLGRSVGQAQRADDRSRLLASLSAAPFGESVFAMGDPTEAPTSASAWARQLLRRFEGLTRLCRRRNLPPLQLPAPIFDGDLSVPTFAHQHLAASRCVIPALRLELEIPVRIPHHPVVVDRARAL